MYKLSLTRLAAAVGGLALSLIAGAGVASADPDLGPIVNTTCSYEQFAAALNAQDPTVAAAFNSSPEIQAGLRQFLAAPRSQRQQMAQRMASEPANRPYLPIVQQAFNTCNNY
jgi:hemophore-related protein